MPSNIDDVQAALERFNEALTDIARNVVLKGGARVAARSVTDYMGGSGNIGIESGRLAQSIRGGGGGIAGGRGGLRNESPSSVGSITPGGAGTRDFPVPGTSTSVFQDESIQRVDVSGGRVRLTKGSRVPYAGVHEHGFSGRQQVRRHTATGPHGTYTVPAHTRHMNIPARPYLDPALEDERQRIVEIAEEELGEGAEVIIGA